MDEDECDLAENFDCPSLLCEELEDEETKDEGGSLRRGEGGEELVKHGKDEGIGSEQEEAEEERGQEVMQVKQKASEAEEETWKLQTDGKSDRRRGAKKDERRKRKSAEEREERRRGRKRRGKKHGDRVQKRRSSKGSRSAQFEEKRSSQAQEVSGLRPEEEQGQEEVGQEEEEQAAAVSASPSIELTNSCDLSDPIYVGCGGAGLYGSTLPGPLLYSSQSLVPIQPGPPPPPPAPAPPSVPAPQFHGTKRPHSPALPCGLPQPGPQPLEMEITQVYSTRRSIRYSTRGQGQALSFSLVPALETVDSCLLPPAPKKKARTLYSTDQLEHLEALFHEDHYPDAEKRKVIATSVGVTPQRIMVWFQNRRAKWRKAERSLAAKVEAKQSRTRWSTSPQQKFNPSLSSSQGALPSFPAHFASKLPQLTSAAPSFSTLCSQTLPSYSNLLASINSPGQSRLRDGAQHQLPSQGALAECHPRPMYSPPPLRRASLPLYPPPSSNPAPPLLSTPPLFLDALEGAAAVSSSSSSSLPLQTDSSSLFDYMTSSQQSVGSGSGSSSNPYQLQASSYPGSQAQHRMAYLTPSTYLTPNAPDSNPASYLTLCPSGSSAGMMAYSSGGHAYYQPQNTGQILLQSAAHHGGLPAYQSYPWSSVYSQPGLHQHAQCPPVFPAGLGGTQPSSSASLPSFFTLGEHGPSHTNPQRPSHALAHTTSITSNTSSSAAAAAAAGFLPPVSTLQPSRLRAHNTPTKAASLLPPQVTPASPDSPTVTPCVKIENDSPQEIHSHFHCDFSPIHF